MKRIVIVVAILTGLAILVFAWVHLTFRTGGTVAEISPVAEDRFLILLFPVGNGDSIDRAVIASLSEYEREHIEVFAEGVTVAMPKADFAPVPPRRYDAYVQHLNDELEAWGAKTDWSEIGYAFTPSEGGGKATVSVKDKTGTTHQYTYIIDHSAIRPVDVTTEVNLSKKMAQ